MEEEDDNEEHWKELQFIIKCTISGGRVAGRLAAVFFAALAVPAEGRPSAGPLPGDGGYHAVVYGPDGAPFIAVDLDLGLPPGGRPAVEVVPRGVVLRGAAGSVQVCIRRVDQDAVPRLGRCLLESVEEVSTQAHFLESQHVEMVRLHELKKF